MKKRRQRRLTLAAVIAAFEREYLLKVLFENNWNRRRAARQLAIGYSTLKGKLRKYRLVQPRRLYFPKPGHS